jgi:hypothetical protein
MSTEKAGIILAAVGILSLAVLAPAATKTAGAGGDYATIKAAHDDLAAWGDGTDVIEVLSGVHTVSVTSAGTWINFTPHSSGSLTIRPQGDFHPVLALTAGTEAPDLPPEFIFLVGNASSGTLTVEGLTFIGADGTDAAANGAASVFRVLARDDGREVTLVVSDCVVTHNTGANVPEFDFTQSHAGGTGNVNQFLRNQDAVHANAVLDVSIEDSILAYCRSDDGFIWMIGNGTSADTERLTLRHTAVINPTDEGLLWQNMTASSRFLSEDSVWLSTTTPLLLQPASAGAPAITLRRSIVAGDSMCIYMDTSYFAGTFSLQDVTLARTSGVDHVLVHVNGVDGAGSFAFTNVIAHPQHPFQRGLDRRRRRVGQPGPDRLLHGRRQRADGI